MAQLPEITKIILEDVPDAQRKWFSGVADNLNKFISASVFALNGRLELGKNIQCQLKDLTFRNSTGVFPLTFVSTLPTRPVCLLKSQIKDISNPPAALTSAVDIDWEYNSAGQIQINNITGLAADKQYRLSVLVF